DRMMDVVRGQIREQTERDVEVRFLTTRGQGALFWSVFSHFLPSIFHLIFLKITWGVDVFHVNIVQNGSTWRKLTLCYVSNILGVPYILHLHGSSYRQYWDTAGPILFSRIRNGFKKASRVIVLGRAWAEYVGGRVPDARVDVLPNATIAPANARQHRNGAEPVHILFLGRIGERKGVPDLIQALARLKCSQPWRATLAGDGEVKAAQDSVVAAGLANSVALTGWIGPADVERMLASADILVLPSHDENLPLSVIEGMAYGLAVVTTPVGAVTDIIRDGETGLLCPPGDPIALAEALDRVVSDSPLRERLGRSARAFHAERLNVDNYFANLKTIWREASCRER
ncbi:MAG TPA: glycosyltransferase family 4 protein, partial [Caulobacteraceae bacterium]